MRIKQPRSVKRKGAGQKEQKNAVQEATFFVGPTAFHAVF